MEKNSVITVLSTISKKNKNYYYIDDDKGNRYYCDGISSNEPALKYYLSTNIIDKIIIVASEETRKEINGTNDVDFFIKRISDEWNDKSMINNIDEPDSVIESIKTIAVKNGIEINNLFDEMTRKTSIFDEIKDEIIKNFNKSFLTEEKIKEYKNQDWTKIKSNIDTDKPVDDFLNMLKKEKFSVLKEAAFCALYKDKLEKWLKKNYSSKDYKTKAKKYYADILKLISEIDSIKAHRLDSEIAFAKEYIYGELDEKYKIKRPETVERTTFDIIEGSFDNPDVNIVQITDKINSMVDGKEEANVNLNLLIDIQGGNRTGAFVINSIISIFDSQKYSNVKIKKIVGIVFGRDNIANEMVDQTAQFGIGKLVAGMNAFIQYGKSGLVADYFKSKAVSEKDVDFIEKMKMIDKSLSICDVTGIISNIQGIKKISADSLQNEHLKLLHTNIQKEYGAIEMDGKEIDILSLTTWALKKEFYQQALTLIESKMPHYIVKHGIFVYCSNDRDKKEFIEYLAEEYNKAREQDRWKFNDIDHYYICDYICKLMKDYQNICDIRFVKNDEKSKKNLTARKKMLESYLTIKTLRNKINHSINLNKQEIDNIWSMLNNFINHVRNLKNNYADEKSILISSKEIKTVN